MKSLLFYTLVFCCANAYGQHNSSKRSTKIKQKEIACEGQSKFIDAIKRADYAFKAEDFETALNNYRVALQVCPDAQYPKDKLAETEEIIHQQGIVEAEFQYSKLIAAADAKFAEKNFLKAKEYYERATTLRSSDPYPKQKLTEIEAILSSQKKD